MRTASAQLKRYLHEALGVVIEPVPWRGSAHLPFFLRERYDFSEVRLLDMPCLVMFDRGGQEEPPATVRTHMDQVKTKWNGEVLYVRERVTAYHRKRLIEQMVPFVVPGNQMYLPFAGIDLREHFKKLRAETTAFSPSTQALVIHLLLHRDAEGTVTPAGMARRLGYSPMTMTRAFDELESAGLGEMISKGRERRFGFTEPAKDVWAKAQPLLRSPVKQRHFIGRTNPDPPGPRAGLMALAHYSMLAEPPNPVFALGREDWRSLGKRRRIDQLPGREPGALEIEVWSYAPALFARDGVVDRLSLHLSLRDVKDERIETALEEMLRGHPW